MLHPEGLVVCEPDVFEVTTFVDDTLEVPHDVEAHVVRQFGPCHQCHSAKAQPPQARRVSPPTITCQRCGDNTWWRHDC